MRLSVRKLFVVVVVTLMVFAAFAYGESRLGPGDLLVGAVVLLAANSLVSFGFWPGRISGKVMLAVVCGLLAIAALNLGSRSFRSAFNECVSRGEAVRAALATHRARHGSFPVQLSELAEPAPCRRAMLTSLLHYSMTPETYELWFGDWLVSHRATDSHPFEATK